MARVLLLRATADDGDSVPPGVDLLVTHEVVASRAGLAEALAFRAEGARLLVTSKTTVRVLHEADGAFFGRPFSETLVSGRETARAVQDAGARHVVYGETPGAAGILAVLPDPIAGTRLLWPHGSDADARPFARLAENGAHLAAPVVYEKRVRAALDEAPLERLLAGRYDAVGVASLAALDALLAELSARRAAPPDVRWGAIGPETAKGLAARGLPAARFPERASLADLVAALSAPARENPVS